MIILIVIKFYSNSNTTFYTNATEQFILNKIYPELYNIYNIKYKNDNEKYV
jgi:hypothetical protein